MSYFNDRVEIDNNIQIDGVSMPQTYEPISITFNNVSDGGRLADNIDYEGDLKGVKVDITLKYKYLNKEHYDLLFNATEKKYIDGGNFFMSIKVPTYTPLGVKTFVGYFQASHTNNCVETTDCLGGSYVYGGANYDEWHEDVEFKFVQK